MAKNINNSTPANKGNPLAHYHGALAHYCSFLELSPEQITDGTGEPLPMNFFTSLNEEDSYTRLVLVSFDSTTFKYFGDINKQYYTYLRNGKPFVTAKIYYFAGSDMDLLSSVLVNIQNKTHHFTEIGKTYLYLSKLTLTHKMIGEILSLSETIISNRKKYLSLSDEVLIAVRRNNFPERTVRLLLKIDNYEVQLHTINKIVDYDISSHRLENSLALLPERFKDLTVDEQKTAIDYAFSGIKTIENQEMENFYAMISRKLVVLDSKNIKGMLNVSESDDMKKVTIVFPKKK